jgi:TolB-like protein
LVDGLGLQLSNELMQFEKYPVIAYYTIRDLWKKTGDISKVALFVDAKYVIAGSLQMLENKVRSHIQLIDSHTNRQVWSCMYEGEFVAENIFKLQDEIVKFTISELVKSHKLTDNKKQRASMIAVA